MAITYRTNGPWGAGSGVNLSAEQIDENIFTLFMDIVNLAENPPLGPQIADIVIEGATFKVILSDLTEFGPFALPIAQFHWKGERTADTAYLAFDIVTVTGSGVYMVLQDHVTGPGAFDPNQEIGFSPVYHQIFGSATIYDMGMFVPGTPGNGLLPGTHVFVHRAIRPFYLPAGLAGSQVGLEIPTTAELNFELFHGEANAAAGVYTSIGEINIAAGQREATFVFPDTVQWDVRDRFLIGAPLDEGTSDSDPDVLVDDTALELSATFMAIRGTAPEVSA